MQLVELHSFPTRCNAFLMAPRRWGVQRVLVYMSMLLYLCEYSHGQTNAFSLPYVLEYSYSNSDKSKYLKLNMFWNVEFDEVFALFSSRITRIHRL